ncbi:MAG: acyl carrier protein [Xanthobacteraceae bacterium]|nr:acyl carrier protein [Xanthobacteraceae bacterium]
MDRSEQIRSKVLSMIPAARVRALGNGGVDASTRLLEVGLIDSTRLLDIILEVETRCGVQFNPEHIDFETGVTLGALVNAFDPASP